ncbi:sensor histidine kinase [Marinilabilia salmonicolor]|uniref:sensor histidine kinase n=1 Tax=Marinilabilia salmonicolor TaxID=989 RepID=UPI0002F18C71|nr:two-component regulator propeller domain-containing protein [Marinilabilia salmonicolor]
MMNLRWLFLYFVFLSASANAQGLPIEQDRYTRFGHLTVADGLPDNHITVIRQDSTGYLWIGTREGLARYDGTRFLSFLNAPGDSTSLPSNHIYDVLITSEQQIFVATRKGLALFNHRTANFVRVPTLYEDGYGLLDKHIRALETADKDHIWVETFNGTLHLLNTQTFRARTWSHPAPTQPYYDYHALLQDSKGTLWIGGRNMGPLKMQKESITAIETDPENTDRKRDRDVAFFFEDSEGDFWVGGLDGLYQYNRESDIFNKRLNTSSYQMTESKQGLLWVATGNGLVQLNKRTGKITLFLPSENDPSSLIQDHLNCVMTDLEGNLWIGTNRGISILNPVQNLVHHYRHLPELPNSLSSNHVSDIQEGKNGNIWIATRGGGMNRFDPETETFTVFRENPTDKSTISSNQVSALHPDENGIIWTGLWRGVGFNSFDPKREEFQQFALDSTSRKQDWYVGFESWGTDTLVAGFWGAQGIRLFHKQEKRWLPHNFNPSYHPSDGNLQNILATDSILWVYQNGGTIRSFHPESSKWQAWRSSVHQTSNQFHKINSVSLPDFSNLNEMVHHQNLTLFLTDKGVGIYDHRNGQFSTPDPRNFLMATQHGQQLLLLSPEGLYAFDGLNHKIQKQLPAKNLVTPPSHITDLLLLEDNKLLITSKSGIEAINARTGEQLPLSPEFESINSSKKPIQQIIHGHKNSFLIAFDRGIAYLPGDGQTEIYDTDNAYSSGLKNDAVRNICRCTETPGFWISSDRGLFFFDTSTRTFSTITSFSEYRINHTTLLSKQLFIASDHGLAVLDAKSRKVTFFNRAPADKLSSHLTTFIQKDSKGDIWAGTTNKGINQIDRQTLEITHFYPGQRFHGRETLAFLETSAGTIYAGGDSLNIFNPEKEVFEIPQIAKQLPNGKILSLTEDYLERILIVTSHHIHIFDPAYNQLFDLTPYLGLKNPTFTRAALQTGNNDILVGSTRGFLRFNPELFSPAEKLQITRITEFRIMGETVHQTNPEKNILLKHDQNFIEFFFSDMKYPSLHDSYQYRLRETDQDWTITSQASVSYKMLPPDDYTFEVQKINPFGESIPAQYSFTIHPPFWKSAWFIILIIFSSGAILFFWWRNHLQHLKLLKNNLTLKHQLLLSQMNPHFLFNALSAIQAFIFQNQPQAAGSYLARFAKLMRLYLNNMTSAVTTIHDESETLKHYLELQRLRHNNNFDYSIEVKPPISEQMPGLPTMMIQPFVENAIEHGFSDIPDRTGYLEVKLELKEPHWHITIRDNGAGIDKTMQKKDEKPLQRKSMSTGITKKRIAQLQNQYKCQCSLVIKDRSKTEENETGTEVSLVLPAISEEKKATKKTVL